MTLKLFVGSAQICALASGLVMASCSQAKEPVQPSILSELSALAPVIACIEVAQRGSPTALDECIAKAGISIGGHSKEPKTAEDFKPLVIGLWLQLDAASGGRLRAETFAQGIDYARCVESAAYADKGFSSRTRNGVIEAQLRAKLACNQHPLSIMALKPGERESAVDLADRMFAEGLANVATTYALEANGWYPNEMRRCIQYSDGTSSVGCVLNPQTGRPPPPSPMKTGK